MPSSSTKIKQSSIKSYEAALGTPQNSWASGVISLVNETRLPMGAVKEAKNLIQTQDGVWSVRPGSMNYGAALTFPVTGYSAFVVYNNDGTTTQWYAVIDNGAFKIAKDGGAWTTIAGHTYSTTHKACLTQFRNFLLIANGFDPFSYYDIANGTLVTFTGLSTPGTVTPALGAGLSAGTLPLYYQVTAISSVGETLPSPVATESVNIARNQWYNPNVTTSASTLYVSLSWTKITNAIGYNIYLSDGVSGVSYYLDSVSQPASGTTVNYTDYGSAAINDFIQVPQSDTTTAPKFSWVASSDNRIFATGDPNNPNRTYWAGTGTQYSLAFSPFVGGGWIDILPGSDQRPTWVGQFRSGQGTPVTTVLLSRPDGYGSTWHVSLQSEQIGTTAITVPIAVQSIGAFGTLSPFGVIETNQNIYFHSGGTGGIYSTGSVPTLFNILATNEISILVRPDVRAITQSAAPGICGIEFDRKLFISVPYGSTTNNRIFVYYLEKQNWNPYAFDFGVNGFFRYTDNSGAVHLLTVPTTGTHLLEISTSFNTDNGAAIQTHLQTGLVHVTPDHMQWAYVQYAYWELGNPNGNITLSYSGTARDEPLIPLVTDTVSTGTLLNASGYGSHLWSSVKWSTSDSVMALSTVNESVKYRAMVNQLLNNWEMEIYSSDPGVQYTLNQFVVMGQYIPVPAPSSWIIG